MATFSVHMPGAGASGDENLSMEDAIFVRDGFSVAALVFGGLWFAWHRMWLVLAGYVATVLLLAGVAGSGLVAPAGVMMLQSLLAFTIGLQAASLRRWHVERKGYREHAVVAADSTDDAELRYFALAT